MKKTLAISLLLALLAPALEAASDKQIADFYTQIFQAQIPDVKVSVSNRKKLENSDLESVEVLFESKSGSSPILIFTQGDLIMPEVIDVKKGISYREKYEKKKFQEARLKFENNVKDKLASEKLIISVGDKSKPKVYVFSDPECPYCRQHLAGLEDELKDYQVNFILTPVHDTSAFEKSALIYKESAGKSDAQKIAIMRKYYDPKLVKYPKVSAKELEQMRDLFDKYQKLGLRSVPTIIYE